MEGITDIYIMQPFFSFTNDFDSSGGRVMKFPASGHHSFLIEVNVNICTKIFGLY